MRSQILCGLWVAVVSLMISVPAYAYSETTNGGNGGLGNGMGTSTRGTHDGISANQFGNRIHVQSNDGATNTIGTHNHEVSVYGTGTGSQFLNVNRNTNDGYGTSQIPGYRTQSYTNGGYRAMDTSSSRDMNWSWLGLLGLLGLFGLRSRNPERGR